MWGGCYCSPIPNLGGEVLGEHSWGRITLLDLQVLITLLQSCQGSYIGHSILKQAASLHVVRVDTSSREHNLGQPCDEKMMHEWGHMAQYDPKGLDFAEIRYCATHGFLSMHESTVMAIDAGWTRAMMDQVLLLT